MDTMLAAKMSGCNDDKGSFDNDDPSYYNNDEDAEIGNFARKSTKL